MGWRKGDVIMTSEPYVHVLSNSYRLEMCSFCFRSSEEITFRMATYQRQDWNVHREECRCLQRVAPETPTDSVLLMLRLIIKHMQGEHQKTVDKDPGLRTFQQLMSHSEEIKQDAERCEAFSKICFTLSKLAGDQLQLPDTQQLLEIFGRMVINTFTIADEELKNIGAGIYLSPASLDHRCTASAVATFQGRTLCVRAVEDIPHGELTQVSEVVFLSYVDQLAPSWERQEQLQQQYYFLCQCQRCCDTSLDRLMIAGVPSDLCDQEEEERADAVDAAMKSCQTVAEKVDKVKKSSGDVGEILTLCRDCLSKTKGVLSPTNVYLLRVLDRGFDAAISSALWEEALVYGQRTLQAYRELLPPYTPNLGLQLLRVGKLQVWLDHMKDAYSNLSQAKAIIAVTHGKKSELYSQLMVLLLQAQEAQDFRHQCAAIEGS